MRFFSIAVFAGLVATSHVVAYSFEAPGSHLQSRKDKRDCDPGEGVNNSRNECRDCGAGTFSAGGVNAQCTSCPAETYSKDKASSCTSCPAGQSSAPGSSSCKTVSCTAGRYISSGGCVNCPAGTSSGPNAFSCSTCPANTYSGSSAGSCTPCPPNKVSSPGSTSSSQCVSKCPAGQVTGAGGCSNCPAGSYANNNVCTDCPAGTISNPGSTTCSVCPGGSVPAPNGQSCSTCQPDTFSNGDVCAPCPPGSTSDAGSTSCGPQPSHRPRSAPQMCQGAGFMRCDVLSGKGGSECINTMTTLDSCGGCVGPEGEEYKYSGRDCTAIENVDQVKCQAGRCNITSCRKGYEPSDGSCVPSAGSVKRGTAHGSRNVKRGLSVRHDSF